ncbi:sulfite exporter TauE/SafE family protein, partial [Idiomarina abyssalis]
MLLTTWLWCIGGGAVAGLLAGMLGIGGGLIIVPLLIYLLPLIGVPPELVVPSAIATSLATICMTTASASRAHAKHGLMENFWLIRVLPGLSLGAMTGAFLVTIIDPDWLKRIFSIVLIALAIR